MFYEDVKLKQNLTINVKYLKDISLMILCPDCILSGTPSK